VKIQQVNRRQILISLVALGAVAILAIAGSSVLASPSKQSSVKRMQFIEREMAATPIDAGPNGASVGDGLVITSKVFAPGGGRVGRLDFACTTTGVGGNSSQICQGVLTLPGGQLTGQFAGESRRQAITGGTGKYKGARGQFVLGKDTPTSLSFAVELLR
jgi:hypothetical protein